MVEARDAALDVTRRGGVALGLHRQVADDVDPLAGRGVLEGDPGWPDGVNLADRRAVQPGDRSAGPAEEDVGQRGPLLVAGVPVDVEHDLPGGAGLDAVEVADRQHGPQRGEVDAVGVTLVDVPGQRAEALPEAGRAAGAAAHAAAGADRLAVTALEVRAPHPPVGHRARL